MLNSSNPMFYKPHLAAFYLCCFITIMVFGVLIYSLIKHRGTEAAHFYTSLKREILWATIPFIILIALLVPTIPAVMR